MKRLICVIFVLCLTLSLGACGDGDPSGDQQTTPAVSEGVVFQYGQTEIAMHAEAEPILSALGEPKRYTEEASCAFEGLDKTYFYGSFYLQTYPDGEKDRVFSLWFADDSVSTAEGVYIGADQSAVEAAYGAGSFNGTGYVVEKGDSRLTILLTDGKVSSIVYEAVIE